MDDSDFEGSLVLEQLAQVGLTDEFLEAVDSDDFATAEALMKAADLDAETIATVLQKMRDADGEH